MNVRLAAQVLRETFGKVLLVTGSAEVAATGNLCLMMDKFFDCSMSGILKSTRQNYKIKVLPR